jgi:hypothetical protein
MRKVMVGCKEISKRKLQHLYVAKRLTLIEIAELYGCNDETIRNYLIKFDIKRRRNAPRYIRSVKSLTPTKASYFAGIVDGEGTITIAKSTRSIGGLTPLLSVSNTDKGLIDWLTKNIGGKVTIKKPEKAHYKVGYRWYMYSVLDVSIMLKMIYPYLIIKKENARKVLNFCEWRLSISMKSRKNPIIYPREPNGNFATAEKIIYGEYDNLIKISGKKKGDD